MTVLSSAQPTVFLVHACWLLAAPALDAPPVAYLPPDTPLTLHTTQEGFLTVTYHGLQPLTGFVPRAMCAPRPQIHRFRTYVVVTSQQSTVLYRAPTATAAPVPGPPLAPNQRLLLLGYEAPFSSCSRLTGE